MAVHCPLMLHHLSEHCLNNPDCSCCAHVLLTRAYKADSCAAEQTHKQLDKMAAAVDLTSHLLKRQLGTRGLALHATSMLVPLEAQDVAEYEIDAVWGRWLQPWPHPTLEEWEERQIVSRRALLLLEWLQGCSSADSRIEHKLYPLLCDTVQYAIAGTCVTLTTPTCLLYNAQNKSVITLVTADLKHVTRTK